MEKKQIQMCKKKRKKNDVRSNIVYIAKVYICLYVYIFITTENFVLQLIIYLCSQLNMVIYILLRIYIFIEHKPVNTIIYTYINSDLYY